MNTANAISFDRNLVLYPNEQSAALSAESGADGSIFLTLQRLRPTVVKLDPAGKVAWTFEGDREDGIDKQFQSSVPMDGGALVVCGSRDPLPGHASQHYPGFVFELDSNGKEIRKYDPIHLTQDKWPFWSALICAKWGDDLLFVANPPVSMRMQPYRLDEVDLAQKIVMRLDGKLAPIWTRMGPVYHGTRITHPGARTLEFDDGYILIVDVDRATITAGGGDTSKVIAFDHCLLLRGRESDAEVKLLCRLDKGNQRWGVVTLNRDLQTVSTTILDDAARNYNFVSAQLLPGGMVAIGGQDQNFQGDVLIFNATGAHLGTYHFPDGHISDRSQDRILELLTTDNGLAVVTQSYKTQIGNTVITWLKLK